MWSCPVRLTVIKMKPWPLGTDALAEPTVRQHKRLARQHTSEKRGLKPRQQLPGSARVLQSFDERVHLFDMRLAVFAQKEVLFDVGQCGTVQGPDCKSLDVIFRWTTIRVHELIVRGIIWHVHLFEGTRE